MKIEKIVIVGGGSAGWMTAATMIRAFPEKQIMLVESPNIATVGVGESTIGGIREWTNYLGIDEESFMKETDATYKLSIGFTDFLRKGSGTFHYPFGDPMKGDFWDNVTDWGIKKAIMPETPVTDFANTFYPQMALVNNNTMDENKNGSNFPGFEFKEDTAFHFDATKFGLWLRDNYCLPRGVTHLLADVSGCEVDDNGIANVAITDGSITKFIEADLYIDCTGFKSMLHTALEVPFQSLSHILPNNSAWATRIPYVDKDKEMESFTNCTAIENGWVWNIPLYSRIGTGYVYSDEYVSDEDALEEFKQHLGDRAKDAEFKNIKMRVGIHERIWEKNCVAIGLSAGFIEPLESNGLYTTHEFLLKLVRAMDHEQISQYDKDAFNRGCLSQFNDFAEFVSLHYAWARRDDTPYWRAVQERKYMPDEHVKQPSYSLQSGSFHTFADAKYRTYTLPESSGLPCISVGLENYIKDKTFVEVSLKPYASPNWEDISRANFKRYEETVATWDARAKTCPTHYEYLTKKFYS